MVCFARHAETDRNLGTPLCLDCYDHTHQIVWAAERARHRGTVESLPG